MCVHIFVGLAILSKIVLNQMLKQGGYTAFITRLIFFLPCCFTQFIEYVIQDYQSSSKVIQILFLLEIVFIVGYVLLIQNVSLTKSSEIVLQKDPYLLDQGMKVIGNIDNLDYRKIQDEQLNISQNWYESNNIKTGPQNYSIGCWLYLNSPGTKRETKTDEFATIFAYTSMYHEFKPSIIYNFNNQSIQIINTQ